MSSECCEGLNIDKDIQNEREEEKGARTVEGTKTGERDKGLERMKTGRVPQNWSMHTPDTGLLHVNFGLSRSFCP